MEIRNNTSAAGLNFPVTPNEPSESAGAAANHLTQLRASGSSTPDVQETFQDFVGQTFFAEMIKAFRSTQQPSEYFHGGRAEEIFQGQFDQVMAEELSDSSAQQISDPMFELFMLGRKT